MKLQKLKLRESGPSEEAAFFDVMNVPHDMIDYNTDDTVSIRGSINLSAKNLTEIPVRFSRIYGDFIVNVNSLTSTINFPTQAHSIHAENNQIGAITTKMKCIQFDLSDNPITTFKHIYKFVTAEYVIVPMIEGPMLPLILIGGLNSIFLSGSGKDDSSKVRELKTILNRHIQTQNIAACQADLINAGFLAQARM